MTNTNRREFLADVGKGMLVASVGSGLAAELGLAPALPPMPPNDFCLATASPWSG